MSEVSISVFSPLKHFHFFWNAWNQAMGARAKQLTILPHITLIQGTNKKYLICSFEWNALWKQGWRSGESTRLTPM